jgi:hypothetical protein
VMKLYAAFRQPGKPHAEFQLTCAARQLILLAMTPNDWPLHDLKSKVLSLSKQIAFYQAFGFRLAEKNSGPAVL